jgi:NAD(P)-dependent dehydrogenase (short-subunit alcohol dehydrogenase family)
MASTILITGAGSGLGHGTALGLAAAGHRVIATVENWPQVTRLRSDAEAAGVALTVDKLDYLDDADLDTVLRRYGDDVDIVVLNAAIGETGPIAEIPLERVRRVFEVNVFRTLAIAQAFAPRLVAKGAGKIVFVSSVAGFQAFPFLAPYVASKHALEAIAQLMRDEMDATGVSVSTINPGPFRTGFNDRMYDTVDQWFQPGVHFTPEGPLREMQAMFQGDELQLDPQGMVDVMVDLIPSAGHRFRTVFPEAFVEGVKAYQDGLWTLTVGDL